MDPHLALQKAVRVFPVYLEGNRLDAGFVAVKGIQDLHGQSLLVNPSGIHAVKHAAPVAGFRPACPGVKRHDRVIRVIGPGQERPDPHGLKCLLKLRDIRLNVLKDGRVIVLICHIDQHQGLFVEILQL